MYNHKHGYADYFNRFIQLVEQYNRISFLYIGAIIELIHLVRENATFSTVNSLKGQNTHLDLGI